MNSCTVRGKSVDLYTLTNANGMKATITNYGGIIVSLLAPDSQVFAGDGGCLRNAIVLMSFHGKGAAFVRPDKGAATTA